jgi:4-hydroxy-3-methylbut-2-enyl diphosphate reductase
MFREAMRDRYGEAALSERFRAFDTICSATQERQDAVIALLDEHRLDVMLVVGGYNSSNTCNLANICAARAPTFHIAEPGCLVSATEIRHRPVTPPGTANRHASEVSTSDWLLAGPLVVGLTAGASTPNNIVGEVVARLDAAANGY